MIPPEMACDHWMWALRSDNDRAVNERGVKLGGGLICGVLLNVITNQSVNQPCQGLGEIRSFIVKMRSRDINVRDLIYTYGKGY